MAASTSSWSVVEVELFITEYYGAWSGMDEDLIMSYYAENVVLQIPGTLLEGKEAVREQFVRPFITAFQGNRHVVKNMIFGPGVVTVEFSVEAEHKGPFAGHAATGARVNRRMTEKTSTRLRSPPQSLEQSKSTGSLLAEVASTFVM